MYQAPLPEEYQSLSVEETASRIVAAKHALGQKLVILGHHYQRDEIIAHADFRGDSYKLCLDAGARPEAEFIVFCGVHFMAESAVILTDKRVILPNLAAGCSMADMANIFQVKSCWRQLEEVLGDPESLPSSLRSQPSPTRGGRGPAIRLIPITYINSAASLKGFVGEKGGTVCTSTNAPQCLTWALSELGVQRTAYGVQGNSMDEPHAASGTPHTSGKILFFPDQHLGRNTAVKLGFDPDVDMVVWDPFKPLGGNTAEALKRATFILWKGHCSVHKRFTVEQIEEARRTLPGVNVIVHPECPLDVVRASDQNGSTERIIKTVTGAPAGTAWAVGTEINLVNRLAKELPDKTIFCLDPQICPCSTMYRIHPSFLLWVLESLVKGQVLNEIEVPEKTRQFARIALERMIQIGKPKD